MSDQPNILLILTDQHMAGTIGAYGSQICRTPVLDELARESVTFDNAYTVCPICSPARASIQTGLYPSRHGMQSNIYTRGCMVHELPDYPGLLSRRLQRQGYQTSYTGKWHMGLGPERAKQGEYRNHIRHVPVLEHVKLDGALPSAIGYAGQDFPGHGGCGDGYPQYHAWLREQGIELRTRVVHREYPTMFDVLSGPESTVSHYLAEMSIRQMDAFLTGGRPFFHMLNFWGPHEPYHASEKHLAMYRDTEIPKWASFEESQRNKPRVHNAHRAETINGWGWEEYQQMIRYCYAGVSMIDEQIGRVMQWLKDRGEYENTVVIFSADHGDSLGVHRGLTDKALFMYEETNRVPLMIKAPGAARGTRESRFAGTCDLYSTVLDYAGVDRAAAQLDGLSLRPLVQGEAIGWRDCFVTECFGLDFLLHSQRALRHGKLKYVFNAGGPDELYDLEQDPHELVNLAVSGEHVGLLRQMQDKLAAWMRQSGDGLLERYLRIVQSGVRD